MKRISIIVLVVMILISAGCVNTGEINEDIDQNDTLSNTGSDAESMKVALLLPGTVADAGWSAAAYEGLIEAEKMFDIEVAFTESVLLAEQESYIRDYANRGYGLIICHGSDYADAVERVAMEFPETFFAISGSDLSTHNILGMDVRNEEQGYMMGFAAALASKSGKVGYIGSLEIVPMKRAEAGFKQGVKAANAAAKTNIEYSIAYTGSMDDVGIGKETAVAMFEKGVDAVGVLANAAGLGVMQAAEEHGKFISLTNIAQVELAPEMTIISVQPMMKANIIAAIDAYVSGEFNEDLEVAGSFMSGLYEITYIGEQNYNSAQLELINDEIEALTKGERVVDKNFE